jgi:hypothetical protein
MAVESPPRPPPQPRSRAAEPPDALIEEARNWQRHRRLLFALLALAAAAVLAGMAWMSNGSSPHHLTVGEIAARESAAIKRNALRVVRVKTTSVVQTSTGTRIDHRVEWADLATFRTRTDMTFPGPPRQETQTYFVIDHHVAGEVATGDVFYDSRTSFSYSRAWITHISRLARRSNPPGALTRTLPEELLGPLAVLGPVSSSRAPGPDSPWLYRIVGSGKISGRPAMELQTRWPKADLAWMRSRGMSTLVRNYGRARYDVWISEATYLPIRVRYSHGTRFGWTQDFAWLPETKANLALLDLRVPAGFAHSVVNCVDESPWPTRGCGYGFGG